MDGDRATAVREIGIAGLAALVYFGVRIVVEGSTDRSMVNGQRIIDTERWLGVDVEQRVQGFVLDHSVVRELGNASYVWLHWPLLIAVLVVVFQRDRSVYVRLRRALIASGLAGLLLFWVLPTAPPRFMPGFEGTVSDAARRHYLGYPLSWANRYASMPSFHVGWTAIACLAFAATLASRRLRVVAMTPAVLVALAVVTTANHYVLDAVVGLAIALVAYALAGRSRRVPMPRLTTQWRIRRHRAALVGPGYAVGAGRAVDGTDPVEVAMSSTGSSRHGGVDTGAAGAYPRRDG